MHTNLRKALRAKRIRLKTVAALLGCSARTVANKLNGKTDFTVTEALMIHDELLQEYNFKRLFAAERMNQ